MKAILVRYGETEYNAIGLDVRQPPPYRIVNTSVNVFSCYDGQWEVVTLNDISHLAAL